MSMITEGHQSSEITTPLYITHANNAFCDVAPIDHFLSLYSTPHLTYVLPPPPPSHPSHSLTALKRRDGSSNHRRSRGSRESIHL